jgi:hypothetical protein
MLTALTALAVTLTAPISSETAQPGDSVMLTASDGSAARGIVSHVQKRRNRGRDGSVTITVIAPCLATLTVTGHSGTLAGIAALGAGGLFIKGKHAVIPAGTTITCTE